MKYFVSTDIEGVTDVTHWDETEYGKKDYTKAAELMTMEVNAVCEGILDADPEAEIWVKDSHHDGRNLDHRQLPKQVRLIRSWMDTPLLMVDGLDESFSGVFFVGYHQGAHMQGNPLSHTMNSSKIYSMKINGRNVAEYHLFRWAAAMIGVPTLMLAGDKALCDDAKKADEDLIVVDTKYGLGRGVNSYHPEFNVERLRAAAKEAVEKNSNGKSVDAMEDKYSLEVEYYHETVALKLSNYPGAQWVEPSGIKIEFDDYEDLLKAMLFIS